MARINQFRNGLISWRSQACANASAFGRVFVQEMVDRADSNGDAAVTLDDFYNIMTKKTFA